MQLRPGDIVGRTIGEPYWALIQSDVVAEPLVAGRQVIVIRPAGVDPALLVAYLQSDAAALQLEASTTQGASISRISTSDLRNLLVPTGLTANGEVPLDEPIRQFRAVATELADTLESRYRAAFDEASGGDIRDALTDAAGEGAMALDLVRRTSDPLHRAREFLPHPLARTIRLYQDDLNAGAPQSVHADLLRFGETAITILGIVGLSFCAYRNATIDETTSWRRSLDRGVALGQWLGAANGAARLARQAEEPLGGLASALATQSPLNRALETFLDHRNDQAHGAGPRSPFEYEQRVLELQEKLHVVVDELAPLARSDWFIVSSLQWSNEARTFTAHGRSLTGDHPDFARWRGDRAEPLESEVVYARFDNLDLPLSGFCEIRSCATCLNEELYYPDRLRGSIVRLRSLDRGHQAEVAFDELDIRRLPTAASGE